MLKLTWKIWLAIWLGITLVFGGLFVMLSAQGATGAAYWLGVVGSLILNGWTLFGLVHWREVTWVKRINTFVLATFGFSFLILLFFALDWEPGWTTSLYCYLAVLGFLLGINLLRLLLRPGHPVLGVARTMIEESLRMGVALIFIIALLVLLPLLPLIFSSDDRVTYMVQRFLTYSTTIVAILLGLMTVLLAARSVSLEIASRQAHMTLTKPVGRGQYLLGKWLGIILLNVVLVAVAGVAIYGFTMGIARNPALNALDRNAVDREVLTARLAQSPTPVDVTWDEMYMNVLKEKQLTDPTRFGELDTSFAVLPIDVKQEVITDTISRFFTVDAGSSQDFKVTGLSRAVEAADRAFSQGIRLLVDEAGLTAAEAEDYTNYVVGRPNDLQTETINKVSMPLFDQLKRILEREMIQLSLTPTSSPKPDNQLAEFYIEINGQPLPRQASVSDPPRVQSMVIEVANELSIPAGLISPDGTMVITVRVPDTKRDGSRQSFVRFNPKDAQVQVFYRVGSFENNLARAMFVIWLKLCFLAMVGLMAGSLLSFPVAAMFALVVYVAAAASGYINESLDSYASVARSDGAWLVITGTLSKFLSHLGSGDIYDAFRMIVRLVGESFMLLMPSFGQFATAEPLSTGQVISNDLLTNAILKIGLLWTGLTALVGTYLFSRKEIARVQV